MTDITSIRWDAAEAPAYGWVWVVAGAQRILPSNISIRLQNNNAPWPYGWGRHEQGETDSDSEHGWLRRFKSSVDAPTWMVLPVNGLSQFRCAPPRNERT